MINCFESKLLNRFSWLVSLREHSKLAITGPENVPRKLQSNVSWMSLKGPIWTSQVRLKPSSQVCPLINVLRTSLRGPFLSEISIDLIFLNSIKYCLVILFACLWVIVHNRFWGLVYHSYVLYITKIRNGLTANFIRKRQNILPLVPSAGISIRFSCFIQ